MKSLFLEPYVHCLRPHLLWTVSTTTVCEARALEETRVEQPGLSQDWDPSNWFQSSVLWSRILSRGFGDHNSF